VEYTPFVEHDIWEGETWKFYIQLEGNETAIEALRDHLTDDEDASEVFEMPEVDPLSEDDVDDLVAHGGYGYLPFHTKLEGTLDVDPLLELEGAELTEALGRGRICDYID